MIKMYTVIPRATNKNNINKYIYIENQKRNWNAILKANWLKQDKTRKEQKLWAIDKKEKWHIQMQLY